MAGAQPCRSHPSRSEVSGRDRLARQRRGRAGERDAALLRAIDVVCRLERLYDVLLDDDEELLEKVFAKQ
jgi:hypothetical protein